MSEATGSIGRINLMTGVNAPGALSYLWSTGDTTSVLSNIGSGNYSVIVTDSIGCSLIDSLILTQPAQITSLFTTTDVSCYGDSTGAVQVVVSGGVPAYSYIWDDVAVNSAIVSNLAVGLHTVHITDDWNCTIEDTISIVENPLIEGNITTIQNVSCYGGSDGEANVEVTGGTHPYTYAWSNGATTEDLADLGGAFNPWDRGGDIFCVLG